MQQCARILPLLALTSLEVELFRRRARTGKLCVHELRYLEAVQARTVF